MHISHSKDSGLVGGSEQKALSLEGGGNVNAKNPPKAAWEMVCLPKSEGGLGVQNLRTYNEALLLKYLHTFFNKADIPWVKLI